MKQLNLIAVLLIAVFSSQISFSQTKIPLSVQKELEAAENKMFNAMLKHDMSYWRNNVSADYVTINADGVIQTKKEAMEDHAKAKMFEGLTYRILDRKVRLYGTVAIINGRSQYLMGDKLMAEALHTQIWKKEKGKWMFDGWQGTLTKESQGKINLQEK